MAPDTSMLALAKQAREDEKNYNEAQEKRKKKKKKRGLFRSIGSLVGGGLGYLGATGLLGLTGPVGLLAAGIATGGGSLLGSKVGTKVAPHMNTRVGMSKNVLTGEDINPMDEYGEGRFADELKNYYAFEEDQMNKNAINLAISAMGRNFLFGSGGGLLNKAMPKGSDVMNLSKYKSPNMFS